MRLLGIIAWICAALALCAGVPTRAQTALDRADPTITERSLPQAERPRSEAAQTVAPQAIAPKAAISGQVSPLAIRIEGASAVPAQAFAEVIATWSGRPLSAQDLADLAAAVAKVARDKGYPLASARIEQQALTNGILEVTLDEGRIDAVRVIGATSPAADKILFARLATGQAVRKADMERAILLVDDLPGITVVSSQYVKQEGFGILLVTIKRDRFTAFVQVDNRGSDEVGPIRSTLLASVRGIAGSADELSLIAAQTPLNPKEFLFLRGRYSLPVGRNGATVSVSASLGDARPGASLQALNVKSKSYDFGASYKMPLIRSLDTNLNLGVNLRRLHIEQQVAGIPLREEQLTLLDAGLEGSKKLAGGVLRADIRITAGLPIGKVSRQGDGRLSRNDGDARFVTASYAWDWQRVLARGVGLTLSSAGQIASRPLLATAEIGAGGPSFGRAYDYSERSGDKGVLGGAELQFDLRNRPTGLIRRVQLYTSVDGGVVSNLRGGGGGGALLSSSVGVRLSQGRTSLNAEYALPLNKDRFDSGRRNGRFSLRLSRSF